MTSLSRTQLPSRSVAKQASHSWLTCAPESASPSSTVSCGRSARDRVGIVVGEHADQNRVSRSSSSERSSMTSSGVPPHSAAMSATLRSTSSGCAALSATDERVEVERQHAAAALHLAPRAVAPRRDRGTRPCAPRSGVSISSWNAARMLNVNGSRRFIWNDERAARHLRPHLDAFGTGRGVRSMIFSCHGKPLTVSSAVQVSGRPIARWISYTSAWVIFSPGSNAATPLPRIAQRLEQRVELGEVGQTRRHRPAAVAVVRRSTTTSRTRPRRRRSRRR